MNWFEKLILTFIFKSYKLIKQFLYNTFVYPILLFRWKLLLWYYRRYQGGLSKIKEFARHKILAYIGMIFLLLVMLKHTEFILFEPDAYDMPMYWPKRIKVFRRLALVHWLSFIWIYTALHIISWFNWRIHYHFKAWGQIMYYDLWFWYSMWYHGIFWTAVEKYLNHGAGIIALIYFTIFNHFLFLVCWGGEFIDDMEYDWDDIDEEYEGAHVRDDFGTIVMEYTEDTKALLQKEHNRLLDDLAWDIFGSIQDEKGESPEKINERFTVWECIVYPPTETTRDELFWAECELYVNDQPHFTREYLQWMDVQMPECDPVEREYWWEYWTIWHPELFEPYIYPWLMPIINFYRAGIRPLHVYPRRRIRAVGEYSRFNWRYEHFLFRYDTIPAYEGFGAYSYEEILEMIIYIFYIIRALYWYWIRGLRYSWRDWKRIWFRRKYGKQLKKLRKWGSINYSFFGKKNYKPKK